MISMDRSEEQNLTELGGEAERRPGFIAPRRQGKPGTREALSDSDSDSDFDRVTPTHLPLPAASDPHAPPVRAPRAACATASDSHAAAASAGFRKRKEMGARCRG